MILVKSFYIKDYVFEIQMYDDVRSYVNEHSYAWRSYRIEIEYHGGNLRSIHLISMPIISEDKLIEKYGKHHNPRTVIRG